MKSLVNISNFSGHTRRFDPTLRGPEPTGAAAQYPSVSPVSVQLQEPRTFELEEPDPLDDDVREEDLFHLRRHEDRGGAHFDPTQARPAAHASRNLSDGGNQLGRPSARIGVSWPQPPQPIPLAERGVILPEQLFRDEPRFQDPHPVITHTFFTCFFWLFLRASLMLRRRCEKKYLSLFFVHSTSSLGEDKSTKNQSSVGEFKMHNNGADRRMELFLRVAEISHEPF